MPAPNKGDKSLRHWALLEGRQETGPLNIFQLGDGLCDLRLVKWLSLWQEHFRIC